jgi:UDP-N-acetylglucosamine 2-epimerase (non-hydrolysing)
VMIDNLFFQLGKLEGTPDGALRTSKIKAMYPAYGVVTLHRPSNVDDEQTLTRIVDALSEIGAQLPLIFPVHPRTRKRLDGLGIRLPESIIALGPLAYMEFLNLFKDARLVLTDSGGVQEETTALGVPCVTLRDNTERPITVTEGTNTVVGTEKARIVEAALAALRAPRHQGAGPALWDGKAAERICAQLPRPA